MVLRRLSFVLLFAMVLSGCSREQIADLSLAMAFQASGSRSSVEVARIPANLFRKDDQSPSFEQLTADLAALNGLGREKAESPNGIHDLDVQQVVTLVDRIQQAGYALALEKGTTQAESRPFHEAQFAALKVGAQLAPEPLASAREAFCQKHFHMECADFDGASTSAFRILNNFVAAKVISREALPALTLHCLTYPDCAMNPQLFGALVERLVNEGQQASATFIAQEGLRLCAHLPGTESLQRQACGSDSMAVVSTPLQRGASSPPRKLQ